MREVSVGDDERNQGEAFNYPQLCSQNSKIARRILHDQNVSRVQCLIQVLQQIVLTTDKSGIGVRWLLSCEPFWCFMFNPGRMCCYVIYLSNVARLQILLNTEKIKFKKGLLELASGDSGGCVTGRGTACVCASC